VLHALAANEDTFELDELAPGDLMFWTGTYSIELDPPITHAMKQGRLEVPRQITEEGHGLENSNALSIQVTAEARWLRL
jgi:hypothetical protein